MKLATLVLTMALASSSNVLAQSSSAADEDGTAAPSEVRAAALYDRGVEAHDQGFFADAAKFFADADELAPNDVTLETALRECVRADAAVLGMRLHVRAARVTTPSEGLRSALSEVVLTFGERVGYVRLACEDCRATLGGVRLSRSIELVVEPRAHVVSFEPDEAGNVEITVKPGEHLAVSTRAPTAPVPQPLEAAGIHPGWLTIGVVVTLGLGAASIGSYVQANALAEELATLRAAHVVNGAADISAAGQNAETRMYAFVALTGVSAIVTTSLAIWAVDWGNPQTATVSLGPGGLHVRGRF